MAVCLVLLLSLVAKQSNAVSRSDSRHLGACCCIRSVLTPFTPFRLSPQLYFYTEVGEEKCFIEELPVDTVVVGHYMAETWHSDKNAYVIEDDMGIRVSVVVSSRSYDPVGIWEERADPGRQSSFCFLSFHRRELTSISW